MKLKTYFITLFLFLLFFNGSILIISFVNLNNNMKNIRECSLGEHFFIANAYAKDLITTERRGTPIENALMPLFQSYISYYGKKNVFLQISKEGQPLYSSMPSTNIPFEKPNSLSPGSRTISTVKSDKREYICVTGELPEPYNTYKLTYVYDISDNIASWNKATTLLFMIGIILSFLLAVCLILLLNHIFKPLKQISTASKSIAKGQYKDRIPVAGNDELSEMAQSFNDMAGEIQNQVIQLANAAEQKQSFIDNFAHELRTPLTAIYGYAEYIQKAAITEEEKLSATGYIMSESLRLQNMAYHLLDLAMLRNDEITFLNVNTKELFQSSLEVMRQKAAEREVMLKCCCQLDGLSGDLELLKCLLMNLIDNGIKACSQGGTVSLSGYFEDGKKVITVQDNGRGMTDEEISHITEAFYRADKSRSRAEGGAGLGLSLCKQIALCHKAEISFSSHPGQGTTAKITFTTS